MYNRNLNNLGDEIKDIVQNAVNSRNYHQINTDIQNTVNGAIDEVMRSIGINRGGRTNRYGQPGSNNFQRIKIPTVRTSGSVSNPVRSAVPVGRISGILCSILGISGISLLGIAIFVLSILQRATGNNLVFGSIVMGLCPLWIASLFLTILGSRIRKRLKRFRQYLLVMGNRNYCMLKDMSSNMGTDDKFVWKDLRRMIAIGMFPEGHIDNQKTCFMLNNESYQEYLKLQQGLKMKQMEEEQQQAETRNESSQESASQGSEFQAAIDAGKSYIRQIKEANDAIPGEEISQKLDRLETVTDKIFQYIALHPEQFAEIQKFMEYYLPTTLKLVNAYVEFDHQPVQGENITTAKKEIEGTLDTINLAFEKLLDSLFGEAAMDVSTDISVLQTLLAQEGLTKKDFDAH
jgi:hypothetical protein